MSENFQSNYQNSNVIQDTTQTSLVPVNGEFFTGTHVAKQVDEISGLAYGLGLPGFRGGALPFWGTNIALTGTAVSSLTSVVFSANQSSYLTQGMLICGASPTSTGFRRITTIGTGITVTIDSPFDVNANSETCYRHGTAAERLNAIESASSSGISVSLVRGSLLQGFTLSNGTDATNDIDFAAGSCTDSTYASTMSGSAMAGKQLDVAWAAGANAGGRFAASISDATWHCFAILKDSDLSVDYGMDTSVTAANRPSGYTKYRRVGSILRESGSIIPFDQKGNRFMRKIPVRDYNSTNPGTSAVLRALMVPTGIKVRALHTFNYDDSNNITGANYVLVTDPDQADSTPSSSLYTLKIENDLDVSHSVMLETGTDTSGQIRTRIAFSTATVVNTGLTHGWVDDSGRYD